MSSSQSSSSSSHLSPTLLNSLTASMSGVPSDEDALAPETDLLAGYIAKSLSSNVVVQLQQARNDTVQATDNSWAYPGKSLMDILDFVLNRMRTRPPTTRLDIRRKIIVDISSLVGKSLSRSDNIFI